MTAQELVPILKKHHFWIISGVVLLASAICWYLANSALAKEYETNKTNIDGKFKAIEGVRGTANHPNPSFKQGVDTEHEELKELTLQAWETLYGKQVPILQWPEITPGFKDSPWTKDPAMEIPVVDRRNYQNYVRNEYFDRDKLQLFNIIKLRQPVAVEEKKEKTKDKKPRQPALGGLMPGMPGQDERREWRGIVAWDSGHRERIYRRYVWQAAPSSRLMRYAQEDIWIYTALLNIISTTNGDSEHLTAPVKRIITLDVGQDASQAILASIKSAAAPGMAGAMPNPEGGAAPGQAPGMGGPAAGDKGLDEYRFVDDKFLPIKDGSKLPYAEFKMIPVRFSLVMNPLKIPDFLVNCANSPLTVEIRRVRLNPQGGIQRLAKQDGQGAGAGAPGAATPGGATPTTTGGTASGTMPGVRAGGTGFRSSGPKFGAAPQGGNMGGGMAGAAAGAEVEYVATDAEVEVLGLIYIFNIPDRAKLGKAGSTQPEGQSGAPSGAPPSAPPAPANAAPGNNAAGNNPAPGNAAVENAGQKPPAAAEDPADAGDVPADGGENDADGAASEAADDGTDAADENMEGAGDDGANADPAAEEAAAESADEPAATTDE